ncbi:MAG: MFS transporter [Alphaproteobacteria bacterium]|nr:MFS transporter [Alphaproteobacteria bacterium]
MIFPPPPFRRPAFRLQFAADLMTSCAFEMETIILGWFILVQTGSVLLLAAFGALQSAGTLCSPFFGLAAERLGTRKLLIAMRGAYTCFAGLLTLLAITDLLTAPVVFVIGTCMGIFRSSDIAMRNLLVNDLIPPEDLATALSISRMTSDLARTAGALAGAAIFAALGIAPAYVAVTLLYALGCACNFRIPHTTPRSASALLASPFGDLRAGFAYAWTTPLILVALILAFAVNFTAYPLSGGLLAYIARDVYLLDQSGFGTLSATFALGGLAGSIALSMTGSGRSPAVVMLAASVVWHLLLIGFVAGQSLALGIACLAAAGFVQNFCMIPMSLLILRTASDNFRGRIIGLRMLAIYGLPLGLTLAGWLTGLVGLPVTGLLYCLLGITVSIAIAHRWRRTIWA